MGADNTTGNSMDIRLFRELVLKCIGARKRKDFAKDAGISEAHLSRMMNNETIPVPSITTLRKLSENSAGRVGLNELKEACGYSVYDEKNDRDENAVAYVADNLVSGFSKFAHTGTRYKSIEDIADIVNIIYGAANVSFEFSEEHPFTGKGHYCAEKYKHVTAKWHADTYSAYFTCTLFYCNTTGGGCIVNDVVFDLSSLFHLGNNYAMRFMMKLSEKENACMADYPVVYDFTYTNNAHSDDVATRFLKAIFGDNYTPEDRQRLDEIIEEKKKRKDAGNVGLE